MSEVVAKRAVVRGRVQGVFFRAFVTEAAVRREVRGWAANREDGSVEVHAEGPADAVAGVLAACRTGPDRARVDCIDVWDAKPEGCADFASR